MEGLTELGDHGPLECFHKLGFEADPDKLLPLVPEELLSSPLGGYRD